MKWIQVIAYGGAFACMVAFVAATAKVDALLQADEFTPVYDQRAGVLCVRSTKGLSHSVSCVRYVPGTAL